MKWVVGAMDLVDKIPYLVDKISNLVDIITSLVDKMVSLVDKISTLVDIPFLASQTLRFSKQNSNLSNQSSAYNSFVNM